MSSAAVSVSNVSLEYPLYSVKGRSLRSSVVNLAIGGLLLRNQRDDKIVIRALSNLSFSLKPGDRLVLLGVNGSGKSTLLRVLAGIYQPTSGVCQVNGAVASMLDIGAGLDLDATGIQNIRSLACYRGHSPWRLRSRIDEIIEFSELGAFAQMPVRVYSSGMLARLLFATATAFPHDILLLEEWLSAGDASFVEKAATRMEGVAEQSQVIVMATHNFELARSFATHVLVLEHGRASFLGSKDLFFEGYDRDAATVAAAKKQEAALTIG